MKKILFSALLLASVSTFAQVETETVKHKRAWEFGLGGTATNWNRVRMSGFEAKADGYKYDTDVSHMIFGPHLYIARELREWLYIDAQGSVGIARNKYHKEFGLKEYDMLYQGGLGLQFRATPLFKSKYVEPFARVGVNYIHKNFDAKYSGGFVNDVTGKAHWKAEDAWNKLGKTADKHSFIPVTFGLGFNAWFSNHWGVGLQGDYMLPLEKDLPRVAQGSVRLIYRAGGKSKKGAPVVQIVDRPVEKIVEKIVTERVEVPVEKIVTITELIENVMFEFDKDLITAESQAILDKAADFLKRYTSEKFLLTGHTDARGSVAYNIDLSKRRAKAVYDELIKRGVPADMIKWRGVGKAISAIPASGENHVRKGDRKVRIERITNMDYWRAL